MNYKEAKEYIEESGKIGSVLGLENIRELLKRLDHPQDRLKFIHIAGTNGKGSVLAFISTILKCSGYKVGRYISPTVFSYREKIQINGNPIGEKEFSVCVNEIKKEISHMTRQGLPHPTSFEIETALSFLYFEKEKCDIVVLETGLGGRLDATNIITNTKCAVFTPISMDHMEYLGNTIEEIARNKAGIIKKGAIIISANQRKEVLEIIRQAGENLGCQLFTVRKAINQKAHYGYEKQIFSYDGFKDLVISLAGTYQIENAALALETVKVLNKEGFLITEDNLRKGLKETRWQGRFTLLREKPVFIIDGAHNPDAASKLRESIEYYFPGRKVVYIMGVFKDKEYEKMIPVMSPLALKFITVTPNNKRALEAAELAERISRYHSHVTKAKDLADAVSLAVACAGEEGVIVSFGSLSYLAEISKVVTDIIPMD